MKATFKTTVRFCLALAALLTFSSRLEAGLTLQGPVYPPAGGVTFSQSGGSDGRAGGNTWYFTNVVQAATNVMYWGPTNNGIGMSFFESTFSGAEIMTFDPVSSSLANGVAVWNGRTQFPNTAIVITRFVLTVSNQAGPVALVLSNSAALGLGVPGNVGGLVMVTTNSGWQANFQFQASFNSGGPFSPALDFFDTYHNNPYNYGGEAFSSFSAGFYYDTPPKLTANNPLSVDIGSTNVITSSLLQSTDVESDPSLLIYTITPNGGAPYEGYLQLNGTNLVAGSTFSQADLNASNLVYVQNGSCASGDGFTFYVNDSDGGVAHDGSFTNFDFNININESDRPPVANGQSINVGLGAAYPGTLTSSNPNCMSLPLSYRLVTLPTKGNVVLNDTNAGTFTYTATLGQTGADSFSFQVNDTIMDATTPGVVSVTIANQPPAPVSGSGMTTENVAYHGQFAATDPDQPPQTLTYSLTDGGVEQLGSTVLTNPATGGFLYTPNPGAFGVDVIHFRAYDGSLYSPTGAVVVSIRPALDPGHVFVTDQNSHSVIEIDPTNGYYFAVSTSNLITSPGAIALEAAGTLLVGDSANGLLRIDPATGNQSILSSNSTFSSPFGGPSGLAVAADGSILAADLHGRIQRINAVTGTATVFSSGGALADPFGVVIAPNGSIYVSDAAAFTGGTHRLDAVDPNTGIATTQTISGTLTFPLAITMDASNIYVADTYPFGPGPAKSVFSVNPVTGLQTQITTGGYLAFASGAGFVANHQLLLALNASASTSSLILVDPVSGTQSLLPGAVGSLVLKPFGVAVVPIPVTIASSGPTTPTLQSVAYLGAVGADLRGTGIKYFAGAVYLCGNSTAAGGFIASYSLPLGSPPVWNTNWPSANSQDNLYGLSASPSGLYAASQNYTRTIDTAGGKEDKGLVIKFPFSGATGSGYHGDIWDAQTPAAPGAFSYGGSEGLFALTLASENGTNFVYATGSGQSSGANGGRLYLSKLGEDSTMLWTQTDGAEQTGFAYSAGAAIAALNTNVYVAGQLQNTSTQYPQPYLRKYTSTGALVWTHTGNLTGVYNGITPGGNYLYAVGYSGTNTGPSANLDFLIDKWDANGNLIWSKTYDRSGAQDVLTAVANVGGRLFADGYTRGNTAGGADAILFEIDPATGNLLSTNLYGGALDDLANGLDSDGTNLYVIGETRSFGNGPDQAMVLDYALLPPPLVLTASGVPHAGQFMLQFTGNSNATYSVLGTTNLFLPLTNWPVLGSATLVSNNVFQFLDSQATNPRLFYRLRSP